MEIPKDMGDAEIKLNTAKVFRSASLRRQTVNFIVMLRPLGNGIFDVVVEVALARNIPDRQNYWIQQNYRLQDPKYTQPTIAVPGKKYRIHLDESVKFCRDVKDVLLEFHPKRKNFQLFEVRQAVNSFVRSTRGLVKIMEVTEEHEIVELHDVTVLLEGVPEIKTENTPSGNYLMVILICRFNASNKVTVKPRK